MTALALAAASAVLFGSMTVALRLALGRADAGPHSATLLTLVPALCVTAAYAAARSDWNVRSAWPYVIAGVFAPGLSQLLFTYAVRDVGASRASVTVGTAPLVGSAIALVALDEPLVAGIAFGAVLIVAGGALLATEGRRPEHFRRLGILWALLTTVAFSIRDNLVRWLGGTGAADTDASLAVLTTVVTGTLVSALVVAARGRPVKWRAGRRFLPAGLLFGVSYVCLTEAFFHGRVTVVSPVVATESLFGVALSALLLGDERVGRRLVLGASLVVAGGVLIGVFR